MGAVLGISAFGRTQEKLAGTAANPTSTSTTQTVNTNVTGMPVSNASSGFGGAPSGGFGSPVSSGFGSPVSSFAAASPAAITTGYGGKKAPPDPVFPEI
jgi:hypothetical protein